MTVATAAEKQTFSEILAMRANLAPHQTAFTFLRDGETDEERTTYLELHDRVRAIAAALRDVVPRGSRALLLLPPGLDYVGSVLGCFHAGVIGVSAAPPSPKRLHRTLPRLFAIAADADVSVVLTTATIREAAESFLSQGPLAEAPWVAVDDDIDMTAVWEELPTSASSIAFLQYTSGSTSDPRGVMLTHANLLENSRFIHRAYRHDENSCGFIWLPPYHDMGLIGGVLQPLYGGFHGVLMSPIGVIKRPARWLEGITRFRATTSGGPNFAYDLCVRAIGDEVLERLDLSSWRVAFNGAEPVRAETLEAFTRRFGPSGFDRRAFYPCYGLAEATLMVTGVDAGDEPALRAFNADALQEDVVGARARDGAGVVRLVGCGAPDGRHDVAIVDPDTLARRESGAIGEIWVAGPSVAGGYWRREAETAETFGARISGEDGEAAYLRTGDLGFVLDGELFVTGRIKELIILNGRNYHPHDLEISAEGAHPMLREHCSAAFSVDVEGVARPVIVMEASSTSNEVELGVAAAAARRQVAHDHDVQLYAVGLCAPGSVPKTTSGKIQRRLCAKLVADGEIELLNGNWLVA